MKFKKKSLFLLAISAIMVGTNAPHIVSYHAPDSESLLRKRAPDNESAESLSRKRAPDNESSDSRSRRRIEPNDSSSLAESAVSSLHPFNASESHTLSKTEVDNLKDRIKGQEERLKKCRSSFVEQSFFNMLNGAIYFLSIDVVKNLLKELEDQYRKKLESDYNKTELAFNEEFKKLIQDTLANNDAVKNARQKYKDSIFFVKSTVKNHLIKIKLMRATNGVDKEIVDSDPLMEMEIDLEKKIIKKSVTPYSYQKNGRKSRYIFFHLNDGSGLMQIMEGAEVGFTETDIKPYMTRIGIEEQRIHEIILKKNDNCQYNILEKLEDPAFIKALISGFNSISFYGFNGVERNYLKGIRYFNVQTASPLIPPFNQKKEVSSALSPILEGHGIKSSDAKDYIEKILLKVGSNKLKDQYVGGQGKVADSLVEAIKKNDPYTVIHFCQDLNVESKPVAKKNEDITSKDPMFLIELYKRNAEIKHNLEKKSQLSTDEQRKLEECLEQLKHLEDLEIIKTFKKIKNVEFVVTDSMLKAQREIQRLKKRLEAHERNNKKVKEDCECCECFKCSKFCKFFKRIFS